MADFVELGATGLDHITNTKGWDRTYDFVTRANKKQQAQQQQQQRSQTQSKGKENRSQLAKRNSTGTRHRSRRELPSPERDYEDRRPRSHHYHGDDAAYDEELERQSVASDRVLRAYENEADDPRRAPAPAPTQQQFAPYQHQHPQGPYQYSPDGYYDGQDRTRAATTTTTMSYAAARPRSQPPRAREYYSDDESDYDERSGRRYGGRNRRGYENRGPVDREIVEREVYRGPPRASGPMNGYTPYAAAPVAVGGAVAPYRRSTADLRTREKSRAREKSRGRRSYSSSRSRSRSRSRGKSQWREKVDETFDTSWQGWGATVAGALIGGAAGREVGDRRNRKRDMVIGALVGGVGANVAENKWREHKEGKEREGGEGYGRREERGDGGRLRPYDNERYERRGRSTG